jgi:hypothetical protein
MPFVQAITSFASLRNNFTGGVGMEVAAVSPCTVTHLGRWVVAGNSGTHIMTITLSGTGTSATVSINTAGAPAGAFLYGALATPFVLTAGSSYFIESAEVSGGDQFYDLANVIVPSGVATIPNADVNLSPNGSANQCFGPLSFIYAL